MQSHWLDELEKMLPPNRVSCEAATLEEFAGDKWARGPLPEVVVQPHCTAEVSTLLRFANERGIAVTSRGGGWGYVGGAITNRGGILLSLDKMNAIREISQEDFVAVVEAGVRTADLQRSVLEKGLFYPPDPASAAYCTLGGNIATNAGGPRCLKYGVTRNYVLGLEVVLADGTILNLGGKTHKNATGFDLLGLFVGSEGLLGVVTGATLKLLPRPVSLLGLVAVFSDISVASRAVNAISEAGFLPAALEIADEFTFRCFQKLNGQTESGGAHLLIEVDGSEAATRAEIEAIAAILKGHQALEIELAIGESEVEVLWATRRQFSMALTQSGKIKWNEDIVVPRGKLVNLVNFASELSQKHGIEIACFGHAGDGNIHVNLMLDSEKQNAETVLDELFSQVLVWGGAITGEHGIGLAKSRWWPQAISPEVRLWHEKMKATLDPQGILNPGKWL